MIRKYGLKWSSKDHRDYVYGVDRPAAPLPPVVDLRPNIDWPAYDQGQTSSCTAHALVSLDRYVAKKDKLAIALPSRLFVYAVERLKEGTFGQDGGAQMRTSIIVLCNYGVCPETTFPFVPAHIETKPPAECYKEAVQNMGKTYYKIPNPEGMKQSLADGNPFIFGIEVYSSFESQAVAATGVLPPPTNADQVLGGHALFCCGYNDETQYYTVLNSWSPEWGDHGYLYIPYVVMHSDLVSDVFTVLKMEPLDPERKYRVL